MYVLAIDQGTSSTKTIVFDAEGRPVARATELLKSSFLEGGFVEQDAGEIYRNVLASVKSCLQKFTEGGGRPEEIRCCGISNQRETFVVWNKEGRPLHPAIVWQCKRSIEICERLKKEGWEEAVSQRTGLLIDPYFSGTKMIWLKENSEAVRSALQAGEAYFGTVDTWLLYRLTGQYATDHTNAARTLFFHLGDLRWDEELLEKFGLSALHLPQIKPSSSFFGQTDFEGLLPQPVDITALIGDSHAAAFGEGCIYPGTAKATLGTGSSIIMNTGARARRSRKGMVTTICWSREGRVDYALEGVIVSCGSTIEWLKNGLGLIADSRETEELARSVPENNGVYLVPAFSGLGAPHWDMSRRASITGLTFDCSRAHVVRAALESIPYQIKDVITAMEEEAGIPLKELMADGGITSNLFVLQFLADLLQREVVNIGMADVSALGAAFMAGLQAGVFRDLEHLQSLRGEKKVIRPLQHDKMNGWYKGWQQAVKESATASHAPDPVMRHS